MTSEQVAQALELYRDERWHAAVLGHGQVHDYELHHGWTTERRYNVWAWKSACASVRGEALEERINRNDIDAHAQRYVDYRLSVEGPDAFDYDWPYSK